jgi:hypothetical protein
MPFNEIALAHTHTPKMGKSINTNFSHTEMQAELEMKMDRFRSEKEKMLQEMQLLNDAQSVMRTQFRKIFQTAHVDAAELKKYQMLRDKFMTTVRFLNLRNECRDVLGSKHALPVWGTESGIRSKTEADDKQADICVEFATIVETTDCVRCAVVAESMHEQDRRHVSERIEKKDYALAAIEEKYAKIIELVAATNELVANCKVKFWGADRKKCKKTVKFDLERNTVKTYELLEDEVLFKKIKSRQ